MRHFKVDPVLKIDETVYKQAKSMCLILVENLQLKLINFRVHTYWLDKVSRVSLWIWYAFQHLKLCLQSLTIDCPHHEYFKMVYSFVFSIFNRYSDSRLSKHGGFQWARALPQHLFWLLKPFVKWTFKIHSSSFYFTKFNYT